MAIAINILGTVLGVFLSVVPLPWYGKIKSIPNIVLSFWLFFLNFFLFANAITWGGNTRIHSEGYCDLVTKLSIGFMFALPTSTLLTSLRHLSLTEDCILDMGRKGWNWKLIERLPCALVPFVLMLLHFAVQDHRFDLVEGYGCLPSVFPSFAAIFIIWVPLMLYSAAAIVVNLYIMRHIVICPSLFNLSDHLQWSDTPYTQKHLIREYAMTSLHATLSLILAISALAFYGHDGVNAFPSQTVLHRNIHTVFTFSSKDVEHGLPTGLGSPVLFWWSIPIATFVFAAANVVVAEYRACEHFYRWLFYVPPKLKWEKTILPSLPFVKPKPEVVKDFDAYRVDFITVEEEVRRRAEEKATMELSWKIREQSRRRALRLKELKIKQGSSSNITDTQIDDMKYNYPPGFAAWWSIRKPHLSDEQRKKGRQQFKSELRASKAQGGMNAPIVNLKPTTYPPSKNHRGDQKIPRLDVDVDAKVPPPPAAHIRK